MAEQRVPPSRADGFVATADDPGGGLLLDASGSYRVAMSAQYAFWAVGLVGVLVTRRQVRRRRNIVIDAFPRGRGAPPDRCALVIVAPLVIVARS